MKEFSTRVRMGWARRFTTHIVTEKTARVAPQPPAIRYDPFRDRDENEFHSQLKGAGSHTTIALCRQ